MEQIIHTLSVLELIMLLPILLAGYRERKKYKNAEKLYELSALHGSTRGIEINYPGVKQLSQKIRAVNAAEISEADLGFINEVLYRHKYIFPLSLYFFPTEKGTKEK